jgi:hypothetical protein
MGKVNRTSADQPVDSHVTQVAPSMRSAGTDRNPRVWRKAGNDSVAQHPDWSSTERRDPHLDASGIKPLRMIPESPPVSHRKLERRVLVRMALPERLANLPQSRRLEHDHAHHCERLEEDQRVAGDQRNVANQVLVDPRRSGIGQISDLDPFPVGEFEVVGALDPARREPATEESCD